jgi:uncharacterized membrane protein
MDLYFLAIIVLIFFSLLIIFYIKIFTKKEDNVSESILGDKAKELSQESILKAEDFSVLE